jgi:hypothetical protein
LIKISDRDGLNKELYENTIEIYNELIINMISIYSELIINNNQIKESNCLHLNNYIKDSIDYYYENINNVLTE